jgi:hypothetical protein
MSQNPSVVCSTRITGNKLLQGLKSHICGEEVYYFVSVEAAKSVQCTVRPAHSCVEMTLVRADSESWTMDAATVNIYGIF